MQIKSQSLSNFQNINAANLSKRAAVLSQKASSNVKDQKLMDVCNDFESIFLNQMFKQMRKNTKFGKPLIDGGMGEEIFKDMLYSEYSKEAAKTNSIGIAKMVYDYLSESQSRQSVLVEKKA